MDNRVVGILGGGQLGRMLVEAAHRLNIKTVLLDSKNSPAKQINALHPHIDGSFGNADKVRELAEHCNVLTTEIEHVNTEVLEELAKNNKQLEIHPAWETVRIIQDKYLQKEHLIRRGVKTPESIAIEEGDGLEERIRAVGEQFGYPFMLKSRTLAYDGRGNFVVKEPSDIERAVDFLGDRPLYAEKWAKFTKELAVMVVRTRENIVYSYPTVETIQENNICSLVYAPARIPDSLRLKARLLAEQAVESFWGGGIYGVEMFLLEDGEIIVNEIAPRPHNSGHYTIEACATSQFEAHLRAILGLPFSNQSTALATPTTNAVMYNLIGTEDPTSYLRIAKQALAIPGATVHLYGKLESRNGRKLGHITIIGGSMAEAEYRLSQLLPSKLAEKLPPVVKSPQNPLVAIIMGSDSDLPTMKAAAEILDKFSVPFELTVVSAHRTPARMVKYAHEARSRGMKVIIAGAGGAAHLPGMVASETSLPVIGVPVKGSTGEGRDSLLSIVQMPRGIPVATMGINNSTNAGLLAVRILAAEDSDYGRSLRSALEFYILKMEEEVLHKVEILDQEGWRNYGTRR